MNGSSSEKRALFDPPINDNTLNNKDDQEPLHKSPKRRIEEEGDEEEKVSISEILRFKKEALWRQLQDQKSKTAYYQEALERVQRNNDNLQRIEGFLTILAREMALNVDLPSPESLWKIWKDSVSLAGNPERLEEFGRNVQFVAQIEQLEARCLDTEARLSETEERLWMAERRGRRLQMQLARLEGNSSASEVTTAPEQSLPVTDEVSAQLKAQLASLEELAKQRLSELERADQERRSLKGQLLRLRESLGRVPASVFQDPRQYDHLHAEAKRLWEELHRRDADLKRLQTFLEERHRAQTQMMESFETDLANRKSHLIGLLDGLEADCNRMRKDRDQMRQMYEKSNNQVASQAKTIAALQESLDALQTQHKVLQDAQKIDANLPEAESLLMAEIETLGGTLDGLQEANRKLLESLERRDEQYNQLLGEKLKIEFNLAQLQRESDLTKQRSIKLEQESLALAAQAEAREKTARQHFLLSEKDLKERTLAADQLKWKVSDLTAQLTQAEATCEAVRKASEKTAAELMEKSTHLDRLEWERNRTAEELRQLKRRLDTTSSSAFPPSTAVKELKDEIDIYRDKDTVLIKCMHAFCRTCIDTRLETRQRKCPNCGEAFGANDVRTIYL